MAPLLTIPREPLARFRLLALWFALFVAVANVIALPFFADGPVAYSALAATVGLAAIWFWGYRHGGFSAVVWLIEPVLLVIVAVASPPPLRALGSFYAGVQLHALYVPRRQLPFLALSFGLARIVTMFLAPHGPPMLEAAATTVGLQVMGLTVIGVTLHVFASAAEKQAVIEQELTRSDERYRLLAAVTRDVFYDWDIARGTSEWSESMAGVFGYSPAQQGNDFDWWLACIHPDDRATFQSRRSALIGDRERTSDAYRYRVKRADGTWAHVAGNVLVQRDAEGRATRLMGAIRDVTHEEHLAEQLRQSQKMEAVGQLAGGVAHDFNNLLTVIGGHVYMLEQKIPRADTTEKHLRGIATTADRAAQLTRQLLAFSRKQLLKPSMLNVNGVVTDVIALIRPLIGEHVQVMTSLDPLLAPVLADAGQLSQVLMNLAINARDAMPNGGTITIMTTNATLRPGDDESTESSLAGGEYVRLVVRDTGIGMTPTTLARAFEPFYTTKAAGSGTGLGLATVYGIIKQSMGDIRATSAPGEGATFTILLPAAKRTSESRPHFSGSGELPAVPAAQHVLLVEDDDGVREFAREVLTGAGYTVHEAKNGVEGLDAVKRGLPSIDVVVTDVVMPKMGGREMVAHLKRERPDLRVLYMTGYTDDAQMLGELRGSEMRLLEKPFSARALARAVADAALQTSLAIGN